MPGRAASSTRSAAKGSQVDDYHGVKVADPYRWLEDADAPETRAWIEAENKVTFGYLERIPRRAAIQERLTELWNYERFGVPFEQGGRYFYSRNDGLQNQTVLYTVESLDAAPRVLLDPNTLSKDGTVALAGVSVSDDGKLPRLRRRRGGIGLERSGRCATSRRGKDLADELHWVKFSGASWTKDGKGFFYSRFDEPKAGEALKSVNHFQKLYYHRLGTPQAEDVLVYERQDQPEWDLTARVTDDGRYLVIAVSDGKRVEHRGSSTRTSRSPARRWSSCSRQLRRAVLVRRQRRARVLRRRPTSTRRAAASWRSTSAGRTARHWKELHPAGRRTRSRRGRRRRPVLRVLPEGRAERCVQRLRPPRQAAERRASCPGIGTVAGFGGKRTDTETFYSFTSFTTPPRIYRYDVTTGAEHALPRAEGGLRPRGLRDAAGLLHEQGRHAGADVHHPQEGPQALTARTRRCSTATAASTSP